MKPLDFQKPSAQLERYLLQLEDLATRNGLESSLVALVSLRVAQINGCAPFVDLYTVAARTAGQTEQRLAALPAWHHSPCFTHRERAALECSEAVTLVAHSQLPDEAWERLTQQLSSEEIVDLTLLVARSHVLDELWMRLTPQLAEQEIDDLALLVTVINTRSRFARAHRQAPELP